MKRTLCILLLIVTGLIISTQAQNTEDLQASDVHGVVSVVFDTSITIASDKLGEMAYAIDAQTKILKTDGTVGTLANISPGASVRIKTGTNPNQATEIQILAPKKEKLEKPK